MRRLTRRQQLAAVLLAVVGLVFLSLDFAGGSLAGARDGTAGALGTLYRGTDSVLGPVRRFVQAVPDLASDRRSIAELRRRNAALRLQLAAAQADQATAAQLRRLQLQADSTRWSVLPARVIGTSPGAGFSWTVTVDVGSSSGCHAGQTVIDGVGLVGRVVACYRSSAVVLLTADPTSGVGVRDTRSGGLLLVRGGGSKGLTATPLDGRTDVRPGDRLQTGPAGQTTYAHGVGVGTVTAVTPTGTGGVTAAVRSAAGQQGLDLLGIVLDGPQPDARAALVPAP